MFSILKARPWLFLSLFLIPILLHLIVWQLSIRSLVRETEFGLLFPNLPIDSCLLIKGFALGSLGGLLSLLIALVTFKLLPQWTSLSKYSRAYPIFWLIPFFGGSLFGFAMASGAPGCTVKLTAWQMLSAGIYGYLFCGLLAGFMGIVTFIGLQLALDGLKEGK